MRLFDLVEQHYRVRASPDALGELATLVEPHIAGRSPDEARYRELLHVLGHVDADESFLVSEQELGQFGGQIGLAHARGTQKYEGANRAFRILQTGAAASDSL